LTEQPEISTISNALPVYQKNTTKYSYLSPFQGRRDAFSQHKMVQRQTGNRFSKLLTTSMISAKLFINFNPLMPTVAIWVQLWSIPCQTGL